MNIGISRNNLERWASEVKGLFEVLRFNCPEGFAVDSMRDFEQAVRGWVIVAMGINSHVDGIQSAQLPPLSAVTEDFHPSLFLDIKDYSETNPFGFKAEVVEWEHILRNGKSTRTFLMEGNTVTRESWGFARTKINNAGIVSTIASAFFAKGKTELPSQKAVANNSFLQKIQTANASEWAGPDNSRAKRIQSLNAANAMRAGMQDGGRERDNMTRLLSSAKGDASQLLSQVRDAVMALFEVLAEENKFDPTVFAEYKRGWARCILFLRESVGVKGNAGSDSTITPQARIS